MTIVRSVDNSSFRVERPPQENRIRLLAEVLLTHPIVAGRAIIAELLGRTTFRLNGRKFHIGPGRPRYVLPIYSDVSRHLAAIRSQIDPTTVSSILDCGAHIGTFSVLAHRIFNAAKIVAIEANPTNYDVCVKNTIGLPIDVRHVAIGAREGTTAFYLRPNEFDQGGTMNPAYSTDEQIPVDVHTTTFRALIDELKHVDVAKVDIEGAELDVLSELCDLSTRIKLLDLELHYMNNNVMRASSDLALIDSVFETVRQDLYTDGLERYWVSLLLRSRR